jgi:integral membrane protein (TIGR00529 family)
MEWLSHIPALVKILAVLCIVMLGLKCRIPLSFSLLIGSVFLGIFVQMSPRNFLVATANGIFSLDTLSLVIIVMGILSLSNGMSLGGRLERIVASFKRLVGESRITLVTFPALIGFLPMPGGAVFSAPMLDAVSQNSTLLPHHKTAINYWFRHIWEYWFPLYPGVILALTLTNVPAWKFILLGLPMTLVALAVGHLIMLRHVSLGNKKHREYSRKNIANFLKELVPIFLVIFTLLFLGICINVSEREFHFTSKLLERAPILVGICLSFSWVVIADKLSWENIRSIAFKRSIWELGLLVVTIMIFRSILERSGGVTALRDELLAYNIPVIALIMALPLITGIVTGIAVGFVGTSFPLVITLIATMKPPSGHLDSLIFIAYVFGFIGMMLSPVHLCLLLTKDYFKANLIKVYYQYLVPLAVLTGIIALVLFLIYRFFQF